MICQDVMFFDRQNLFPYRTRGSTCQGQHSSCCGACRLGVRCHSHGACRGRWRWRVRRYRTRYERVFHRQSQGRRGRRTNRPNSRSSMRSGCRRWSTYGNNTLISITASLHVGHSGSKKVRYAPDEYEYHSRTETRTLGNCSDGKHGCDSREHALVDAEHNGRNVCATDRGSTEYALETEVL